MKELLCPFRFDVRPDGESEIATCGFLQQVTGVSDAALCAVHRSACEACCASFPSVGAGMNPVMPSLLYGVCEQADSNDKIDRVKEWCESALLNERARFRRNATHACDVVMYCEGEADDVNRAIGSVLGQERSVPFLHLVHDCRFAHLRKEFEHHPRVRVHHDTDHIGLFPFLHRLIPDLESQFIAVQTADSVSRPFRLSHAIGRMDLEGAEFFVSAMETPAGIVDSERERSSGDSETLLRFVAPTLVIRRSTLVDMGGVADVPTDHVAELITRACDQSRSFLVDATPTVTTARSVESTPVGVDVSRGMGFAQARFACDVVLPFKGNLDFVEEAIESVIEQDFAEPIVHLIDDGTEDDTSSFLSRWKSHARVRVYRNRRNIGQFASFNNVFPFVETDRIAVQDGDDISLPNRLANACNHMHLAGCDLFAAKTRLFGDPKIVEKLRHGTLDDGSDFRESTFPQARRPGYFLENPTVVIEKQLFGRLGGFTDFGSVLRNRTGVDTEFMNRAYFGGAAVGVSRDVVLLYRCHGSSATQHPESGWGSDASQESSDEYRRRMPLFLNGPFNPSDFGALGLHDGVTERL